MDTIKPTWQTKTDPGTAGRKGGPKPFNAGPQGYHRAPQRPARSVGLFFSAWILALCPVVQSVDAQETSEIAKQAQNPIASMISVPFENDFNPQTGINKEDSYVLEMKPVVPFTLSKDWNLITRTIIPVIQVPDLAPGVAGTSGVGDVQESLFLSPAKAGGVADRSQFFKDLSMPFYGYNKPDAKISPGVRDSFWLQGMQASIKGVYDCIKAFSETDFTEDLKKIDVPTLILQGDADQIVPIDDASRLSVKLVKNSTLKVYPGAPHGICTTHADQVNADLLSFLKAQ